MFYKTLFIYLNELIINRCFMKTIKLAIITILLFVLSCFNLQAQNWDFEFEKKEIKVWTRKLDWSKIKECKGETIMKTNLGSIISVFDDVPNFPKWVYNCSEAKRLRKDSDTRGVIYCVIKLPWPAKNRSMTFQYLLTQDKNTKEVTIRFLSTKDRIPEDGNIRMTYFKSHYILTPISPNEVKVVFQSHADPAGDLPQSIINMFLNDTPYKTLLNIRNIVENPSFKKKYLDHVEELSK